MLKKFLIIIGVIILAYSVLFFWPITPNDKMTIGVSFDPAYARFLGLDDKMVFTKLVKDAGFKYLRFSAHWDTLEIEQNKFDFKELDYYFDLAEKNKAKVILAVGQKTPRWPECYAPQWATGLSDEEYFSALDNYVETTVKRYQKHPALEMWQVENEPFFAFGEKCRKMTRAQLEAEIKIATASGLPIIVTDSGELSAWRKTVNAGDWFGTTLYRVVWNKTVGYFNYDWLPASFYRLKFWFWGRDLNTALVAELQAEPWLPGNNPTTASLAEQAKSMNLERLKKHLDYAADLGVPRAYLWGAEWWVWLEKNGDKSISEYIKQLDKHNPVFTPAP